MKTKIIIATIILLPSFFYDGAAQTNELKFNLVKGTNGKPLGKINAITQDPHGYIWLCGSEAKCIYRYDGNRFIIFRHDDSNINSLGLSSVETIYADNSGIIWIGGEGLDEYNPATRTFKHYKHQKNNTGSLAAGYIYSIIKDRQGRLWVGSDNGLDCLDEKTGKFTHYRNEPGNPKSLSSNVVWRIYEDHQGVIWIGTGYPFLKRDPVDGGLNRLNNDGSFTRYMHDPGDPHTLINNKVAAMFEDSRGTFWVGTGGDGLHIMDRKTGRFERRLYDPRKPDQLSCPPLKQNEENDKITFITGDITGAIWVGTMYSGINRYDTITKKVTHFENSNGFTDTKSWNAFTSREGELWITTENANLFRVDPFHKSITSIPTTNLVSNFLEDNEGYLWVGTRGSGLLKYDQHNNLIRQYKHEPADSFSMIADNVSVLFQNQENTIWVGTDIGLRVFDKATQKFSKFQGSENLRDFPDSRVTHITPDKNGLLWFSTWGHGLTCYSPKEHSIKHFFSNTQDSFSISSNEVGGTLEDRTGAIWSGGSSGINRFDRKTEHFKHYLPKIWGVQLFQDSEGELWTGNQIGLFRYDPQEDRFSAFFGAQQEIDGRTVGGIVEDDAKNLWIPSQLGIIKLNPRTKEIFIYDSRYGIDPHSLVPWARTYKNKKGQIFIPHETGFYTFSPDELAVNPDFNILITDFFINNLPVLPGKKSPLQRPVEEINDLALRYNQNNFAFNFAAIDYRAPEVSRYFTMLENYDNTWREVSGEKSSYYFNLSPGKYLYRIRVINNEGVKKEKTITIRVYPPWWNTWWFLSLAILFTSVLLYVFIQYRSRNLKKNNLILEKKVLQRTTELNNSLADLKTAQDQLIQSEKMASLGELTSGIAHEIKNPLNFINNFSEINLELLTEMEEEQIPGLKDDNKDEIMPIVKSLKKNSDKINHHGKRIDEIVKGMLQHSRLGNATKEPVNINALCDESLNLAYHGFRAKEKTFNASFETRFDPDIPKIMAIPQDLGRVLLNLINNAFYTVNEMKKRNQPDLSDSLQTDSLYKPSVIVSTKKSEGKVSITISDNGMGISPQIINKIFQPFFTTKPTGEGTGLGLSMSYDIISKSHGGEIRVKSKEGLGTDFEIVLPIK